MPTRTLVAKELATLFGVVSHPDRIRIIIELRNGERDVNSLQDILGISHSRVSQHLSTLRAHRLVEERRSGRHVYYRLSQPRMAEWLVEGLEILAVESITGDRLREAIANAKSLWEQRGAVPHDTGVVSGPPLFNSQEGSGTPAR